MGRSFAILGSRGYPSTYGGFETFVRRLAPYLAQQGHDVTVYCRDGKPGVSVRNGIRCITTRGVDANAISTLSHGANAGWHARRQRFDAVLVLNVANGFYLPMLRRANIPTLVNVDGLEWERAKWNRLGKAVFRRGATLTARHATEIVVDSLEVGRIWRDELGRGGQYVPYGADVVTNTSSDRIQAIGLVPGGYALAVARLVPENNIGLFLDGLDRMSTSIPAVVVGSRRKSASLVQRLRARDSARKDFHWLGHVDDHDLLAELWANCAVYFHGHSVGGTNPALLQAMGLGAPTVALNTRFNAEVIEDTEQLVEHDPRAVASIFEELMREPTRRELFAKNGRKVIAERYTWDAVLMSYRDTLERLAASPNTESG